jgi:rod shape-determining protein MreD
VRSLRFAFALLAVYLLHVVAVRLWPAFPRVVDLFLVLIVHHAVRSSSLGGMLGGLFGGLVEDAVTGTFYGLYGIAGTVVGYAAARGARALAVQQPAVVALLVALFVAVQQALLTVLLLMMTLDPPIPQPGWLLLRCACCAAVALVASSGGGVLKRRLDRWRGSRDTRVRLQ